jgi:hypothetical protein
MATASTEPSAVALSGEEHTFLLNLLGQVLHDKKIEEHRTEAFAYRKHVQHEIALLQGLIDKLQRP